MSPQFPIVKGVEVLLEAPEGYEVDFDNPQLDHTNIRACIALFAIEYTLCLLFFGQRVYTNAILLRNFRIDDCMFHRLSPAPLLTTCFAIQRNTRPFFFFFFED